ncbi:hypothetical protein C8R46DRAFT_1348077, partial [Mycena filopes]
RIIECRHKPPTDPRRVPGPYASHEELPSIGRPLPGPPTDPPTRNWACALGPDAGCNITLTVLVELLTVDARGSVVVVAPWS